MCDIQAWPTNYGVIHEASAYLGAFSLWMVSNHNMTLRKWAVRIACLAAGLFLCLVLLTFLAIQTQQRMLRWRAERLSSDIHQIRLYQSTWADAQKLMHRWGAWGHYDGSCSAQNCKYEIEMGSIGMYVPRTPRNALLDWLLNHDRLNLYEWFGGRGSRFGVSFTVHEGTIWRQGAYIGVSVPKRRMRRENDFEWSLSVGAQSYQRLHRTLENPFVYMGGAEDLAGHPYYKVGRPGGRMINCQVEVVYFSPRTPPSEIKRLTSYNFSCFTRFSPCMHIEELLPAAQEWHLYDSAYESGPTVSAPHPRPLTESYEPISCKDIPAWAIARDSRYVLAVEVLSVKTVSDGEYHHDVAKMRVISSLKEPAPWSPSALVSAHLNWEGDGSPSSEVESLLPGKQYIVFAIGNDQRDQILSEDSPLMFERCGVREDGPEIRRELEKGFAQNDSLNP